MEPGDDSLLDASRERRRRRTRRHHQRLIRLRDREQVACAREALSSDEVRAPASQQPRDLAQRVAGPRTYCAPIHQEWKSL